MCGPVGGDVGRLPARHPPRTPARSAVPSATAGQRGWKRQPAGMLLGAGGSPSAGRYAHYRYEAEIYAFILSQLDAA